MDTGMGKSELMGTYYRTVVVHVVSTLGRI
jgi:hypothetical protein